MTIKEMLTGYVKLLDLEMMRALNNNEDEYYGLLDIRKNQVQTAIDNIAEEQYNEDRGSEYDQQGDYMEV